MKDELLETVALSAVFFGVLFALGLVQRAFPAVNFAEPVFVAIALVPVLFFLVSTNRLRRLSGAGFEVVLREQARKLVAPDGSPPVEAVPGTTLTHERIANHPDVTESKTALAFTLGPEQGYELHDVERYLTELPGLRFVVFEDATGRFEGYMHADEFEALVDRLGEGVVAELESGDVLDRESVRDASVGNDSSNEEALDTMEANDVEEVAVLDSGRTFLGVVTQDEIVRNVLSRAIRAS